MYWKLVLTRQYTWLNTPNAGGLLLPWFQLQASELHRWAFTFWDPYQWCGQPLIGQGQAGTAYPFNWILWALPLHHGWLRHVYLNWYLVLIHFQAAGFMYWLCRDLGRSVRASLFAGLAFSVGPFLGTADWPVMLNAAVWAPVLLLFFLRAFRGIAPEISAIFCGAALGMAWLSGNDQIPLLLTILFTGLWIWVAVEARRWKLPLLVGAAAFGVSALQSLPTLEYIAYSPDSWWTFLASFWNDRSVSPLSLPGVVAPQYEFDAMLYTGWTLLVFAGLGFWNEARSREVRLVAAIGLGGLLISLGHYIVFEGILYGLRGLAREPKSGLVLFGVCTSLLAAFGIDALRRMEAVTVATVSRISILLGVIGGVCWIVLLLLAMTGGNDLKRFTPLALCAIGAVILAGLLEGWRRGAITPHAGAVCAILLAMWEFGNVTGSNWVNVEYGWSWLNQLANGADAVQFLRSQIIPVRVDNAGLPYQFGDWNGLDQFDGITGGTQNVIRASAFPSARSLAGVGFSVGTKPVRPGQVPVFDSPRGVKIFSNADAAPRTFVVHQVISANSDAEVASLLSRPVADLRKQAFVAEPAPKVESCDAAETAVLLPRRGRTTHVKARLACTGLLVFSETWYPGWHVEIDGRPEELFRAYSFLQAAVVPAGVHDVTFTYRPTLVWIGGAITFLTLSGVLVLARRTRRSAEMAG